MTEEPALGLRRNDRGVNALRKLEDDALPTLPHRSQMRLSHQPCYALATATPTPFVQFGMDAWTAIQAPVLLVDGLDFAQQRFVGLLS